MADDPVTTCEVAARPCSAVHPVASTSGQGLLRHRLRHQAQGARARRSRQRWAPTRRSTRWSSQKNEADAKKASEPKLLDEEGLAVRKRWTSAASRSETIRPAPPSGSVTAPVGLRIRGVRAAARSRSSRTGPSSAGPRPCRCVIVFGACQEMNGKRMNPAGREHPRLHRGDDLLLAARAREVVLARVAVVRARARERERLLAVDVRRARLQAQRVAAVA